MSHASDDLPGFPVTETEPKRGTWVLVDCRMTTDCEPCWTQRKLESDDDDLFEPTWFNTEGDDWSFDTYDRWTWMPGGSPLERVLALGAAVEQYPGRVDVWWNGDDGNYYSGSGATPHEAALKALARLDSGGV